MPYNSKSSAFFGGFFDGFGCVGRVFDPTIITELGKQSPLEQRYSPASVRTRGQFRKFREVVRMQSTMRAFDVATKSGKIFH